MKRCIIKAVIVFFLATWGVSVFAGDLEVFMAPNPVAIGQVLQIAMRAPENVKSIVFVRHKYSFVYLALGNDGIWRGEIDMTPNTTSAGSFSMNVKVFLQDGTMLMEKIPYQVIAEPRVVLQSNEFRSQERKIIQLSKDINDLILDNKDELLRKKEEELRNIDLEKKDLEQKRQDVSSNIRELADMQEKIRQQNEEMKKKNEELKKLREMMQQHNDMLQKRNELLKAQEEQKLRELVEVERMRSELNELQKKADADIHQKQRLRDELGQRTKELQEKEKLYEQRYLEQKREAEELASMNVALEQQQRIYFRQVNETKMALSDLSSYKQQLEQERTTILKERDRLQQKNKTLQNELASQQVYKDAIEKDIDTLQKHRLEVGRDIEQLTAKREELSHQEERLSEEHKKIINENEQLLAERKGLVEENYQLREEQMRLETMAVDLKNGRRDLEGAIEAFYCEKVKLEQQNDTLRESNRQLTQKKAELVNETERLKKLASAIAKSELMILNNKLRLQREQLLNEIEEMNISKRKVAEENKELEEQKENLLRIMRSLTEEIKKKITGRPLEMSESPPVYADKYTQLTLRRNPNIYYYTGEVRLIVFPRPVQYLEPTFFVVNTPEEVDNVLLAIGERQYTLHPINEKTWAGTLVISQGVCPEDQSVLITLERDRVIFHKSFALVTENEKTQWNPYLTEEPLLAEQFPVFPKAETETVSVSYQVYESGITESNLLHNHWLGVTTDIKAKGLKTVTFRSRFMKGSREGFSEGIQRDETLMVTIEGKVGNTEIEATFHDSSVDLDDSNKNSILLKDRNWSLYFGEYATKLTENEFTSFSKQLDGIRGDYRTGPYQITFMTSEAKGIAAHDEIFGDNSQGPYRLQHRPVVIRSEGIRYMGRNLSRDTDYTIDYEAGEIVFKRDFIGENDAFTVEYEYADTMYKRTFTALRTAYQPSENTIQFGLTFLNQEDSTEGISRGEIMASGTAPQQHTMVGFDGKLSTGQLLLQTEAAYSQKDTDLLSRSGSVTGYALKQGIRWSFDSGSVDMHAKKLGSSFCSLGNASLNPGLWGYEVDTRFKPVDWWSNAFLHTRELYIRNGGHVSEMVSDYATQLGSLYVKRYAREDLDRSVSGNYSAKLHERQTVGLRQAIGWVSVDPSLQMEEVRDRYNPSSNYESSTIRIGLGLVGAGTTRLSTDVSWQRREQRDGVSFYRRALGINGQAEPLQNITLSGAFRVVDDTKEGRSALADTTYSLQPSKYLRFFGNYGLETLNENIEGTMYRVMKHNGDFQVRYKPVQGVSLQYKFKPVFSEIRPLDNLRYDDRLVNQYNIDVNCIQNINLGIDIKDTQRLILNKALLPATVTDQKKKTNTILLQSTYAISNDADARYSCELEHEVLKDLTETSPNAAYQQTNIDNVKQSLVYQIAFSGNMRLGFDFLHEMSGTSLRGDSGSNEKIIDETAGTSIEWVPDAGLSIKLTGSGKRSRDLLGSTPDTYVMIPRIDLTCRPAEGLLLNCYYEYSRSLTGQEVRVHKASLHLSSDIKIQDLISLTFSVQTEYEYQQMPEYYETLDTLAKASMVF